MFEANLGVAAQKVPTLIAEVAFPRLPQCTVRLACLLFVAATGCSDTPDRPDGGVASAEANVTGKPIDVPADRQWHWIPFPDAHCADGSTAGVAVNFTDARRDLAIAFQGGGQCWSEKTCVQLPLALNLAGLPADPLQGLVKGGLVEKGLWNRDDADNPFRDWNYVAIAYCTGDGHLGNRTTTYGTTTLQHVGFVNTQAYLARIAPTFADAPRVLVTGSSAGGEGAMGNYDQVARAFQAVGGPLPILVDDAGPVLRPPYMPIEAQQEMDNAWGLDKTLGVRCPSCTPEPGYHSGWVWLAKTWPGMRGALLSSVSDDFVRELYGIFNGGLFPVSPEDFSAGLNDFADYAAALQDDISPSQTRVFYYPGGRHMALVGADFSQTPGLTTFLEQMLDETSPWQEVRP